MAGQNEANSSFGQSQFFGFVSHRDFRFPKVLSTSFPTTPLILDYPISQHLFLPDQRKLETDGAGVEDLVWRERLNQCFDEFVISCHRLF